MNKYLTRLHDILEPVLQEYLHKQKKISDVKLFSEENCKKLNNKVNYTYKTKLIYKILFDESNSTDISVSFEQFIEMVLKDVCNKSKYNSDNLNEVITSSIDRSIRNLLPYDLLLNNIELFDEISDVSVHSERLFSDLEEE